MKAPYLRFDKHEINTQKDRVEHRLHQLGFCKSLSCGSKETAVAIALSFASGQVYRWLSKSLADNENESGWAMWRKEFTNEEEFFAYTNEMLRNKNKGE